MLVSGASLKTFGLAVAASIAGFIGHQLVEKPIESRDQQIEQLTKGQAETHTEIELLTVSIARVEGKLDVINQKIEDDRSPSRR